MSKMGRYVFEIQEKEKEKEVSKNSWNREEIEIKIREAFIGMMSYYHENNLELGGFDHNKWIKENL